jgi:hypothetical protein
MANSKIWRLMEKVKEALENIEGIAEGKARVRIMAQRAVTPEVFEKIFQVQLEATKPVHAWVIRWNGANDITYPETSLQTVMRDHDLTIFGFKSYSEHSDEEMLQIAERIMDSLTQKKTLGIGLVTDADEPILMHSRTAVANLNQTMLGPVLCSFAEFRVTAREWKGDQQFT